MPIVGPDIGLRRAAERLGLRHDPYAGFNFLVEIEGLLAGGFTEVGGLQVETEVEPYREGGNNEYLHQLPGPARHPARLVLKRGLTDSEALWDWHQEVVRGRIERRNGTIYLLDAQGLPATWWDVRGAYPVKWMGPELRADANAVAVESLELVHRGLSRPFSGEMSAARGAAGLVGALS